MDPEERTLRMATTLIEKVSCEEFIPDDFVEDDGRDTIPSPPPACWPTDSTDDFPF
jgi:hypothetical protein